MVRMMEGWAGSKFLVALLCVGTLLCLPGCATLLHGERQSMAQEDRGGLDWGAFVLNLVFFWPGIFVDMATGTAWNPKSGS
jgi:hypothetical protein